MQITANYLFFKFLLALWVHKHMTEEYSLNSFLVTFSLTQLQGQVQNNVLEAASLCLATSIMSGTKKHHFS